jgi:hypothetical protein
VGDTPNRITVMVEDHTGNKQRRARIAADAAVHDLLPALITALELPMTDPAGRPVTYHVGTKGQPLADGETLAGAGVVDGDSLTVVPEMSSEHDPAAAVEALFRSATRDLLESRSFALSRDVESGGRGAGAGLAGRVAVLEQAVRRLGEDVRSLRETSGMGPVDRDPAPTAPPEEDPPFVTLTISIDGRGQRRISAEGALVFNSQDDFSVKWEVDGWAGWMNRTADSLEGLRRTPDAAGAEALWSELFTQGQRFHHDVFDSDQLALHQLGVALGRIFPGHEDRLVLRFAGPRHYLAAPFELLRDPDRGFMSTRYSLVRRVDGIPRSGAANDGLFAREDGRPLTALFVASASRGSAAEEAARAQEALLEGAERVGRHVSSTLLGPDEATLEAVKNALERCDAELVHVVAGAEFDLANPDESGLLFPLRAGDGRFQRLTARHLGRLFEGSRTRLLFLSAPGSAATGGREQLARVDYLGVVDAAVHAGVPAVVGYRWTPSDAVSVTVAKQFYRVLAETGSVPRAACRARHEAWQMAGRDPSWAGLMVICQ